MAKYEILYIIRPNIEEEAKNALVARFDSILTDNGATVVESKDWMIPGEATRVLIALDLALFSSFTLREGSRSFIGITYYTPIPLFFELASIAGSVPFPYRDIPWQSVYQLVPRVSPE